MLGVTKLLVTSMIAEAKVGAARDANTKTAFLVVAGTTLLCLAKLAVNPLLGDAIGVFAILGAGIVIGCWFASTVPALARQTWFSATDCLAVWLVSLTGFLLLRATKLSLVFEDPVRAAIGTPSIRFAVFSIIHVALATLAVALYKLVIAKGSLWIDDGRKLALSAAGNAAAFYFLVFSVTR
jgi:F0F1-type ATP synthase membrane subunit c/vacuolar-type H+-ATPase subunit K